MSGLAGPRDKSGRRAASLAKLEPGSGETFDGGQDRVLTRGEGKIGGRLDSEEGKAAGCDAGFETVSQMLPVAPCARGGEGPREGMAGIRIGFRGG